jgi:hypothetical protein
MINLYKGERNLKSAHASQHKEPAPPTPVITVSPFNGKDQAPLPSEKISASSRENSEKKAQKTSEAKPKGKSFLKKVGHGMGKVFGGLLFSKKDADPNAKEKSDSKSASNAEDDPIKEIQDLHGARNQLIEKLELNTRQNTPGEVAVDVRSANFMDEIKRIQSIEFHNNSRRSNESPIGACGEKEIPADG